jgi:hypothetical protein
MGTRRQFLGASIAAILVLGFSGALAAARIQPRENARIEALIAAVGQLHGATFIRNGSAHTAAEAASHLRLKWMNAGRHVRTAEDFIRYCATGSSITGRPYRIRLADGREMESADFFNAELRRIDAAALRIRPRARGTPPSDAATPTPGPPSRNHPR